MPALLAVTACPLEPGGHSSIRRAQLLLAGGVACDMTIVPGHPENNTTWAPCLARGADGGSDHKKGKASRHESLRRCPAGLRALSGDTGPASSARQRAARRHLREVAPPQAGAVASSGSRSWSTFVTRSPCVAAGSSVPTRVFVSGYLALPRRMLVVALACVWKVLALHAHPRLLAHVSTRESKPRASKCHVTLSLLVNMVIVLSRDQEARGERSLNTCAGSRTLKTERNINACCTPETGIK